MRAFLVALAGLGIALLAALLIAPRFVDWNRFKPEIAALAERATGRQLTIDGDIGFSLLPTPTLSAAGVRLGNPANAPPGAGEPELVRLKALDARIALGPLLGGRVVVESIALVEPVVVVDLRSPSPDALETLEGRLSFDRILVVDGSLEWRGPGLALKIDRINAEITASSVIGPFRVSGDVAWRGLPWRFELTTGRLGEAAPISASLGLRGGGATVRVSGTATLGGGETLMAGRLRAEGNRLPELLAAFGVGSGGRLPAPLAQAATLEANLQIGRSRIALNDLALTLGDDMRAAGAAGLTLEPDGAFDLALALNRIDVDKWSNLLAAPAAASAAPGLPRGTLDVTVDAVLWRGGVIRQARLNGALGASGLTIRQAAAQLPGGSDVSVFGHLALGDAPRFDGQLEGGADNLRSLFDWLQIDAQSIAPDRLRRVSVTTGLSITGDGFELANIDLQFDASRLTGSLVAALGARPAFGANLRLNRINLEAYLPRAVRAAPPAANDTPPARPVSTGPPLEWLTTFDANLQLRVDQLSYNTLPLQGVLVDATLERATLSLHELSSESAAGVRVIVGGVLRRARWPAEAELTVSAQGADPSRLFELLGYDGASPALGPFSASLAATGPLDRLHLVLDSEIAGGALRALGDLDLATPNGLVLSGGSVTLRHAETLRLLRALFPGYRPAAEGIGPFELAGTVSAAAGKLELGDGALTLGPSAFAARAALDVTKPRPELALKLAGAVLVLDPLLARRADGSMLDGPSVGAALWAGVAALPATLAGWPALDVAAALELGELDYGRHSATAVALDLSIQDRGLRVTRLGGAAWDGTVVLTGALDVNRDGAAALRVSLADVSAARAAAALFGVPGLDGRLDLDLDLTTSGLTERDLRSALAGKGRVALRDGALPGFDLEALAARLKPDAAGDVAAGVAQDLSRGRSAITRGSATVSVRGARLATEDANFGGPGGAIDLRGGVDLATRQLDLRLQLRPVGDAAVPPARLRAGGSFEQPTREVDAQALIGFLSARRPSPAAGQPVPDARRSGGR